MKMRNTPTRQPTRRAVIKTGTAAVAALTTAPGAFANTAPQLMRHASREIVLEFDVTPGNNPGDGYAPRPLSRPGSG